MRNLIYILLLTGTFCQAQQTINRQSRFPVSTFDYPNKSNPNPELIVNDAAALDPSENVNALNISAVSSNSTLSIVVSDNGATTYSRKVVANTGGSLRRSQLDRSSILTDNASYDVDLLHRHNATNGNARSYMSAGDDPAFDTQHSAHTDWQLHSYTFTANGTRFRWDECVRAVCNSGDWVEFNMSLKLSE